MQRLVAVLIFIFLLVQAKAFVLKGKVTDIKGEALAYTNIYVKGSSYATSCNVNGEYSLELKAGTYEIIFQHIGFKQVTQTVLLQKDETLNIVLEPVEYDIRDVVVNASDDPANEVIRKAIEKRKYFLNAVESYQVDAYIKGVQRLVNVPSWAKSRLNKAGIQIVEGTPNILYLSESVSKLYYKRPGKFKEVIYSSKVSGRSQGFTYNSAQDFYFNFYERSIAIPVIAQRPLISPLHENAFYYYKFKMLGAYKEGDVLVNKIQVTPKRKNDACFNGVLSIIENNWNIHSLQLFVTKDNGIEYLDSLTVTQYFIPVQNDIWLPSQQRYDAKASFLGLKGDGYYLGVFKNYELNKIGTVAAKVDTIKKKAETPAKQARSAKKEEKKIFTPEIIKIEEDANKRDIVYWDSIRPVPLTAIETDDYLVKDSIQEIKESRSYKDSTDKRLNKPNAFSIITGYSFRKQYHNLQISLPSMFSLFNFNTVEGPNFQFKIRIQKGFEKDGKRLSIEPVFRYGITNRSAQGMVSVNYRISQKNDESISVSGGKFISQIDERQPQPVFGNTFKSLIFRWNDLKLYEQYYARITYNRELYNGIFLQLSGLYAQRTPLENTNRFSFFPKVKDQYSPNGVSLPWTDATTDNIQPHNTFRLQGRLRFKFGQQFVTRPDFKIRTDSKYPELTVLYRKAIAIKGFSDINYDYLEGYLDGKIEMKQAGVSFYKFGGGWYPNRKRMEFSDYKHFSGVFLNQGNNDLLGFYNIGFYRHSTNQYFAEAHLEHHFNGLFFSKIPGINKLKLKEVLGGHMLYTPTRKQYFQLDVGIENIFKILRADFVTGFGSGHKEFYFGGRIGLTIEVIR